MMSYVVTPYQGDDQPKGPGYPRCFKNIPIGRLYNFFDWFLNQKLSMDGREKRGMKTRSSFGTYF
jgi:hypothetical protein